MRLLLIGLALAFVGKKLQQPKTSTDYIEQQAKADAAAKAAADAAANQKKAAEEQKRRNEVKADAALADKNFTLAMAGGTAAAASASIASVGPSGLPYLAIAMASVRGAWNALTPEDKADLWNGRNPGTSAAARFIGGHAGGATAEAGNQAVLGYGGPPQRTGTGGGS